MEIVNQPGVNWWDQRLILKTVYEENQTLSTMFTATKNIIFLYTKKNCLINLTISQWQVYCINTKVYWLSSQVNILTIITVQLIY